MRTVFTALVFGLAVSGCRNADREAPRPDGEPSEASGQTANAVRGHVYPRANWRIARDGELQRTVLWVSHILIRHQEVPTVAPPFAPPNWTTEEIFPRRTRAEAFQLAQRVRLAAKEGTKTFAEVAREHSEDGLTAPNGGSLGGIRASELSAVPAYLDALAVLKPGDVSQVIESRFGFHIIRRMAPPAPVQYSARHIVIGYEGATWLSFRKRGAMPTRSRDEALALVEKLAKTARQKPEEFEQLVDAHSDHRDAVSGGDIGVWSSREPTLVPRATEALLKLPVGGVTEPVDTAIGFQIFQRTLVTERAAYAMEEISVRFDPTQPPEHEHSKERVSRRVEAIAKVLQKEPKKFSQFQAEYGGEGFENWTKGRGRFGLSAVLDGLAIGEIAPTPHEVDWTFVIARRADPALHPEPEPLSELPTPEHPDLLDLAKRTTGEGLAKHATLLKTAGATALNLEGDRAQRFERCHDDLAKAVVAAETADERVAAMQTAIKALGAALGAADFSKYEAIVGEHTKHLLMGPSK